MFVTSETSILLVEDTLTQAMYMQHALTQAGYKVTVARSGEKALDALKQIIPDVVLTDINMPGINGYELIEAMRKSDATREIKTILLITAGQLPEVAEILNSTADGIVFKSASQKTFVGQVKLALAQVQSNTLTIDGAPIKLTNNADAQSKSNHFLLMAYRQIIDLQAQ